MNRLTHKENNPKKPSHKQYRRLQINPRSTLVVNVTAEVILQFFVNILGSTLPHPQKSENLATVHRLYQLNLCKIKNPVRLYVILVGTIQPPWHVTTVQMALSSPNSSYVFNKYTMFVCKDMHHCWNKQNDRLLSCFLLLQSQAFSADASFSANLNNLHGRLFSGLCSADKVADRALCVPCDVK